MPSASAPKEPTAGMTVPVATYNIGEYNWSGFSCPYCSASRFVDCPGQGGHLACDGTAELRNGRRFHQCFCGEAGFISGTPMKTLKSKRLSVEADVGSPNQPVAEHKGQSGPTDIALPSPTRGQPRRSDECCRAASDDRVLAGFRPKWPVLKITVTGLSTWPEREQSDMRRGTA
jgi:hypothetical protein